jgi:hypothetical protein
MTQNEKQKDFGEYAEEKITFEGLALIAKTMFNRVSLGIRT